jgi:hypothetical protein
MYECPTCGIILERTSTIKARRDGNYRHKKKCDSAKPEERRYYKRMGHWPAKGINLAKYRD